MATPKKGVRKWNVAARTAPQQWTVWQLASHVAGVRAYWFGLVDVDTAALRDRFRVTSTTVPGLAVDLPAAGGVLDDCEGRVDVANPLAG